MPEHRVLQFVPNPAAPSIAANRQRIVPVLPTAHRSVSVASDRQRIAPMGGGGRCRSRHLGARLLPFLRCLCPRVSAGDYSGNLTNCRENARCAARSPTSGINSLPTGDASRNRPESASKVSAPADIQGGEAVAEETQSGLNDALSVRNYPQSSRAAPV